MPIYRDLSGTSGVIFYEYPPTKTEIKVTFEGGAEYVYDSVRPGVGKVAEMIALADAGRGLNTFVSTKPRITWSKRKKPNGVWESWQPGM